MGEEEQRFQREILGVAALLLLGSAFVIYPFLDAIVLALVTSYLLRFSHRQINQRLDNDFLSSVIIITTVMGLLFLGLYAFIKNFQDIVLALQLFTGDLQQNITTVLEVLQLPGSFRAEVLAFINSLSGTIQGRLEQTLVSLPSLMIDIGIFLVTAIFLYRDGGRVENELFKIINNLPENEQKIVKSLIHSMDSIFRGVFLTQFTVAAILGVMAVVGFYLISVVTTPIPFILLWGILIGMAALIPLFAAFMIYGPISLYYLLFGEPVKGSLILIFGIIFLNIVPEIFLRPFVGSRQMDEHPLIIFLGFLAGPLTLGLKGLILGPLVLILSKEFIMNYTDLISAEEN